MVAGIAGIGHLQAAAAIARRGHREDPLRVGCVDALQEGGVPVRTRLATDTQVDHENVVGPCILDDPVIGGGKGLGVELVRVARGSLHDDQARVIGDAGRALAVVGFGGHDARHMRAMALEVGDAIATRGIITGDDVVYQVLVARVAAGVDDRHGDGGAADGSARSALHGLPSIKCVKTLEAPGTCGFLGDFRVVDRDALETEVLGKGRFLGVGLVVLRLHGIALRRSVGLPRRGIAGRRSGIASNLIGWCC